MKTLGYVLLALMMFLATIAIAHKIGDATSEVMGRTLHTLEPKK